MMILGYCNSSRSSYTGIHIYRVRGSISPGYDFWAKTKGGADAASISALGITVIHTVGITIGVESNQVVGMVLTLYGSLSWYYSLYLILSHHFVMFFF